MFKKILFPLVALFMLAGCAKPPTTIEVSPTITLPQQDPSLMGVTVALMVPISVPIRRWQKSPAIIKSLP